MKFIPGPIGTNLSGKLGATVASHNRGGPYFRRRSKPVIVSSNYAEDAKSAFSAVSAAWGSLEEEARKAWTTYASNNPIVDRIGQKVTLDGHAMYVKCNANQGWAGGALLDLPPLREAPAALGAVSVAGTVVSGALNILLSGGVSVQSQILMVRAGVTNSPGREYVKGRLRLLAAMGSATETEVDILEATEARIGSLVNGNQLHVAVSVYDPITGLQSAAVSGSGTIAGNS